jgi:hypothetical protein
MKMTPMIAKVAPNSGPHAGSDRLLLFAHGIGVDGGDFQDGVWPIHFDTIFKGTPLFKAWMA